MVDMNDGILSVQEGDEVIFSIKGENKNGVVIKRAAGRLRIKHDDVSCWASVHDVLTVVKSGVTLADAASPSLSSSRTGHENTEDDTSRILHRSSHPHLSVDNHVNTVIPTSATTRSGRVQLPSWIKCQTNYTTASGGSINSRDRSYPVRAKSLSPTRTLFEHPATRTVTTGPLSHAPFRSSAMAEVASAHPSNQSEVGKAPTVSAGVDRIVVHQPLPKDLDDAVSNVKDNLMHETHAQSCVDADTEVRDFRGSRVSEVKAIRTTPPPEKEARRISNSSTSASLPRSSTPQLSEPTSAPSRIQQPATPQRRSLPLVRPSSPKRPSSPRPRDHRSLSPPRSKRYSADKTLEGIRVIFKVRGEECEGTIVQNCGSQLQVSCTQGNQWIECDNVVSFIKSACKGTSEDSRKIKYDPNIRYTYRGDDKPPRLRIVEKSDVLAHKRGPSDQSSATDLPEEDDLVSPEDSSVLFDLEGVATLGSLIEYKAGRMRIRHKGGECWVKAKVLAIVDENEVQEKCQEIGLNGLPGVCDVGRNRKSSVQLRDTKFTAEVSHVDAGSYKGSEFLYESSDEETVLDDKYFEKLKLDAETAMQALTAAEVSTRKIYDV